MRKLKQVFSFSCICQPTTACRKNSGHLQPRGNRDEEIGFGVRPPRAFGRFETGSKFRRNGNDFFSALAKVIFFLKKNLFLSDCFCSEATKILFQNDFLALQLRKSALGFTFGSTRIWLRGWVVIGHYGNGLGSNRGGERLTHFSVQGRLDSSLTVLHSKL